MILETTNLTVAALNGGLGLFFIGLCVPLLLRKVPMNWLYGFRIGPAMQSDDDWYDINAYGAKWMMIWSIPIILVGLAALFVDFRTSSDLRVYFNFAFLIVIIPVAQTAIYALSRD